MEHLALATAISGLGNSTAVPAPSGNLPEPRVFRSDIRGHELDDMAMWTGYLMLGTVIGVAHTHISFKLSTV